MSEISVNSVYNILMEVRVVEAKLSELLERERGEYDVLSPRKCFERIIIQCGKVGGAVKTYWGTPGVTVQQVLDATHISFDENHEYISFNGKHYRNKRTGLADEQDQQATQFLQTGLFEDGFLVVVQKTRC